MDIDLIFSLLCLPLLVGGGRGQEMKLIGICRDSSERWIDLKVASGRRDQRVKIDVLPYKEATRIRATLQQFEFGSY